MEEEVDLSNRGFVEIPDNIFSNRRILKLGASRNYITFLPPEIRKLTNLRELYIVSNKLTSLPPEIGKLVNLEQLDVSYNQLTSLPSDIGKLVNLEIFCFWQSTDFSSF